MNAKKRWLHLCMVVCLALGWAFIPAGSTETALAGDPPPPAEETVPEPGDPPADQVDEEALIQAVTAREEGDRLQALAIHSDPSADQPEAYAVPAPANPDAPAVDRTVGSGCTYATVGAAVAAANPGDRLLLEGGVTFPVNLSITKSLTFQGGYNGCGSHSTDRTTLDGGGSDRVMYLHENLSIVLENLIIKNGNTSGNGAGIFVGPNTLVTGTNLDINNNTAGGYGGGVRLFGGEATFTNTNIHHNVADAGAGVYGEFYNGHAPALNLVSAADLFANDTLTAPGLGGGVYMSEGTVMAAACSDIYSNQAIGGGGAYLITSTLTISGNCSEFELNTATGNGGGIYALDSTITVGDQAEVTSNKAVNGGGAYLDNSSLVSDGALITYNRLSTTGHQGAGLYLTNASRAALIDSAISNNYFETSGYTYGGGAFVNAGSVVTMTNSILQNHQAQSISDGRGAGLYVSGSKVTLDATDIVTNTAGTVGGGIRLTNTSTLNILNGSELRNNHATNAEGGAIAASGTPDINISNSILKGNSAGTDGGAVHLWAGTLDFTGWWSITDNQADSDGGAIAIDGTGNGTLLSTTAGSSILGNHAGKNGGALYLGNDKSLELYSTQGYLLSLSGNYTGLNGGAAYADSGGFIDVYGRVVVTANRAPSGNGGAFYLSNGSKLWLDDHYDDRPEVRVNWAQNGGAIYAMGSAVGSPQVRCDGADLGYSSGGNYTLSGSGGAIYLADSSFNADNCVFFNNQAEEHGGAIAAYTSTVTIQAAYSAALMALERMPDFMPVDPQATWATGCNALSRECSSFYGNEADSEANAIGNGGAIFARNSTLNVSHTYLHHNSAARGGAVYQEGDSATGQVTDVLVHHNSTGQPYGAGMRVAEGSMTLMHVTIADNLGGAGYSSAFATVTNASNTIAWSNASGGFARVPTTASCNIDQSNLGGPNLNPRFVNPGAGEDYHLSANSPAINACTAGTSPDLENQARPHGIGFEMGAFEYQPVIYLPIIKR